MSATPIICYCCKRRPIKAHWSKGEKRCIAEKRVSERNSYKEKFRFDVEFKNSSRVKKDEVGNLQQALVMPTYKTRLDFELAQFSENFTSRV